MDLSVNNKYTKAKNINFKGFKYTYDTKNNPVFKFTAPPHKDDETASLEIMRYVEGGNTSSKNIKTIPFSENNVIEFDKKDTKFLVEKSDGLLYRYKIGDKYYWDNSESFETSDGDKFNIIKTSKNYGITPKTGTMRHSFVDSDVSENFLATLKGASNSDVTAPRTDLDFVRNHFNKLGGSIKGLDYLLTKTKELDPYRYLISTPDIGADPTSSHKYWPNNLYQCTDVQAFKDLNFHLFERGKGYVADGAFTSQSLQSPLVQHVYKWGKESPWFRMLKIDENVNLGILPDNEKAMEHVGVKVINDPNDKNNYREGKPTYIQFYDDRLVSPKKISSDEIIKNTDKLPKDHYEITSNDDSVYMFYFEVAPNDKKHLDVFKKAGSNNILLKDMENPSDFLKFDRFEVQKRTMASNAKFWDGNTDMIKMNFSNSNDTEAMQNARQYIYAAATYWTEMVQSDLILRSAKLISNERLHPNLTENKLSIKNIAKNNGVDIKSLKANLATARFPVLEQNKTINDYIQEFPLQSLETSPELSAIFAQPDFNKELFSKRDFIARMELAVENTINNAIPENYKDNPEYKQYVIKTYAPEIIKNIFASSLDKNTVSSDGTINYGELKDVNLKSMQKYSPSTPDIERRQVITHILNGFNPELIESTQEKIAKELKDITLEDFKLAESLVVQSKAGLNWRFDAAKDIGDMDDVRGTTSNFSKVWKDVEEFWVNFIHNVRKYNPSSYIINEITDMWGLRNVEPQGFDDKLDPDFKEREFLNITGSTTSSNYSTYFNRLSGFIGTNPENLEHYSEFSGNLDKLRETVDKFISANQPNNINLSHSFVENHDKPRVLHVMPLDIKLFHSGTVEGNPAYEDLTVNLTGSDDFKHISPRAIAVAQVMSDEIEKSDFTDREKEKLHKALAELALGRKNSSDKSVDFKRSEAFGTTPYEISIRDLFKRAGITENLDENVLNFHSSMLSKAMKQQISLWEMMNAIPGTPTLFNGAEFAQTGFESPSKNIYQTNRNPILHYLKNDPRYQEYYDKMQAVSGLYKLEGLSAIRDGAKVMLDTGRFGTEKPLPQGSDNYIIENVCANGGFEAAKEFMDLNLPDEQSTYDKMYTQFGIWHDKDCYDRFVRQYKSGIMQEAVKIQEENNRIIQMLPMFSYDDKGSEVLQIITNHNVPKSQQAKDAKEEPEKEISSIELGENCPWQDGTVLKRKVYKNGRAYSDETIANSNSVKQKYIVKNGCIYPALKTKTGYEADENKKITIDDTVLTFYKV